MVIGNAIVNVTLNHKKPRMLGIYLIFPFTVF